MTEHEWMEQFENSTLPNSSFHHADHVRMAFLYLEKYPALEALSRFSSALARFATANGKPQLYHETITWAYVLLIRERLAHFNFPPNWEEFAAENETLLRWDDNILRRYYRPETLKSDLARHVFLFPDRF